MIIIIQSQYTKNRTHKYMCANRFSMQTAPMADEIFVDDGAAETSSSESGESDWQENEERERVEG